MHANEHEWDVINALLADTPATKTCIAQTSAMLRQAFGA
jgi:hypothetical protein